MPWCPCLSLTCPVPASRRYPQDPARRKQWIVSVLRQTYTEDNDYVCSRHFSPDDLDDSSPSGVRLREGAVPMLQYGFRCKVKKNKGKRKRKEKRRMRCPKCEGKRAAAAKNRAARVGKEGEKDSGCEALTTGTGTADPQPAPPRSPSKETLKTRLAEIEGKLEDAGVKISRLRQCKSDLESYKNKLDIMTILLENRATYNRDYIATLEEMLKKRQTGEGAPSQGMEEVES